MDILIISSCTGEKKESFPEQPCLYDFRLGPDRIADLEKKYSNYLFPAEELYSGQQHLRLMEGVKLLRNMEGFNIDLHILSAGYGLIPANQKILPYEVTFNNLKSGELKEWASQLNIPVDFRNLLAKSYDLCLVLLGGKYWEACDLKVSVESVNPVLAFCNSNIKANIGDWFNFLPLSLVNKDAKHFSCGLIGLKGELGARYLVGLSKGLTSPDLSETSAEEILVALKNPELILPTPKVKKGKARAIKPIELKAPLPHIDKVITLSESWENSPHRQKLRYFIPDWDDFVDPEYDFLKDKLSNEPCDWSNAKYAHQMYEQPSYDGILVSKITIDQNKRKQARILEVGGVHRQLRLPDSFPIMGDCGAFGYIKEEEPPFTTSEILDYYSDYGFDLGVSIDHIIVGNDLAEMKRRYEITINNAEEFLVEHKKRNLPWVPIGAVQGWDPESYASAAQKYVKMGYKYIGVGGLVRRNTKELLSIVEEITSVVPRGVDIHLFGISRLNALRLCQRMGVTSVDSASYLRKAWLGQKDHYYTLNGENYAALRIPEVGNSVRAKKAIDQRGISFDKLKKQEVSCIQAVRNYDKGNIAVNIVLDLLEEYDGMLDENGKSRRKDYERTLTDKPWKSCPCSICKESKVEVVIFRNNNRNRRRGFHNTYVFYELLKQTIQDPDFFINGEHRLFEEEYLAKRKQLDIF